MIKKAEFYYELINKLISSKLFKDRHIIEAKHFTRKGKLKFDLMILFTLKARKKTTQIELNNFFLKKNLKIDQSQQQVHISKIG